ncbi:MAG TPA: TaqI-like C-terminal specificity domain-containing protein, partial [Pirellulaceae bacterium]|nr:TaqI-like C-terminal specificity domain-containing protein [Pirellulaceae bacterium]
AYEIAPAVRDLGTGSLPRGHAKFVVSGNIRPGSTTWATVPVQYLKTRYFQPIVDLERIPERRREQATSPKIIVSGLTKRPTAFFDRSGEYLAGKSTVLLMERRSGTQLDAVSAILNSELGALIYLGLFGGLALAGGYLRFGPPQIATFPVPQDMKGLADSLRAGTNIEQAVCESYGVQTADVHDAFIGAFGGTDDGIVEGDEDET